MASRTRIRFKDLDIRGPEGMRRLKTREGWSFVVFSPWGKISGWGVIIDRGSRGLDIEFNNPDLDPLEVEALMAHYEVTQEGKED